MRYTLSARVTFRISGGLLFRLRFGYRHSPTMASLDADEGNVPWGKYTYALEGLATNCYLEGFDTRPRTLSRQSSGQRLCFRVELPDRCFVLSVSVKLPNSPPIVLRALDDIVIERALSNGDYTVVYDGSISDPSAPLHPVVSSNSKPIPSDDPSHDSPTSVEQTSSPRDTLPRKKVIDVRRAADALRLTMVDIEDAPSTASARRIVSDSDASDAPECRTLGVTVVGYTRGQTPAANRLKILLNSSARLPVDSARADRAEVDGLLGLAFLGSRRYRQAAELLQRASELIVDVAADDAKAGYTVESAMTWASELNLLSAHAYFEHMPLCNDGIVRLIQVATMGKSPRASQSSPRDVGDLSVEFLDLRTELLNMLQPLINNLVAFLAESQSAAVRMASARTIEFISEQVGCGMAPYMSVILNQVLRSYAKFQEFGARERAAAASFSYDSMEDCYERLVDICCRLFPLTEHSVLHRLYENTLVPVFLDGFREGTYLLSEPDGEEADEMVTTAIAQTLRVIFLVLSILGADARIPTSLISRILNILVLDHGCPRTPLILRRTALHTWDALCTTLIQTASGNSVKAFEEHFKMITGYFPKLLVQSIRVGFEYRELEEDDGTDVQIFKDEQLSSVNSNYALDALMRKRKLRTEIADRHTLRRMLSLITSVCSALGYSATDDDDIVHSEVLFALQEQIGRAIADVAMSTLLDISFHEAVESGNGYAENNISLEFGHINNQLTIISEILGELFECYWSCLSLLPSRIAEEAVRSAPIRTFLGWCVNLMHCSAPPKGMLCLICVCVKGLVNETNISMFGASKEPGNPSEVTFLNIYRALLLWLPQSAHAEAFDLLDILHESVAGDLLASDLLLLIKCLGDQRDIYQSRTEASLESVATIIAACTPKDPEQAVKSLKELPENVNGKQRLSSAFPKAPRSNTGSFNKKFISSQPRAEPILKAFYLHVVLSSCFDRFDALAQCTSRRAGPSYMGDRIDAFVEHAALAVRCLHVCARSQSHREYVGVILGDIFGTCLAMEDYTDSRVRLAGFEIFAAALDVLFLAKKATMLGKQKTNMVGGDVASINTSSGALVNSASVENMNGITELASPASEETNGSSSAPFSSRAVAANDLGKSGASAVLGSAQKDGTTGDEKSNINRVEDEDEAGDRKMKEIFGCGGSWIFQADDAVSSDLTFETRAWQMLCAFISTSLGVGKYVDFVVQRASLEYLRNCLMNALRGRSSGANVISFEHIEMIWEAVSRLMGSPWRALNSLAMWVTCAVVNVAVYATVLSKGRGAARQKSTQLNDFVTNHVFQRAESLLKSPSRESRVWGMRLLEVYVRSRDLNANDVQVIPTPPVRILRCLQTFKNDWNDEIRKRSQDLLEIHFNSINRKSAAPKLFSSQAQSFMYMKRNVYDELDPSESSQIELWFPPLPDQLSEAMLTNYQCNLHGFASNEIVGGEEIDLVKVGDENEDDEDGDEDDDGAYDDDDEGYELDSDEKVEGVPNSEGEENENAAANESEEGTEEIVVEEANDKELEKVSTETNTNGESQVVSVVETEGHEEDGTDQVSEIPGEQRPCSPASSTDADYGSDQEDPEELIDPPVDAGSDVINAEVAVEDQAHDEDEAEEDDEVEEDREFSSLTTTITKVASSEEEGITPVSEAEVDDFGLVPIKTESFDDDEADEEIVEEDDLVVDVTDEDDVLVDVDSIPEEKLMMNRLSNGAATFNALLPSHQSYTVVGDVPKLRRPNSWSRPASSNLSMNPDLDEGVHVLRRKGSFTNRPTTGFNIEEGDVPKLARRRSIDHTGLAANTEAGLEGDEAPSPKTSSRLSRRKSMKTSSGVSKTPEVGRSKGTDANLISDKGKEDAVQGEEAASSGTQKQHRKRATKSVAELIEEKEIAERAASKEHGSSSNVDSNRISGGSSKGYRIQKAVKPDEEIEGEGIEKRPTKVMSGGLYGSEPQKDRSSKSAGDNSIRGDSKPARRSLPRAPAFVKGGGLQRRNSGPSLGAASGSNGRGPAAWPAPGGSLTSPTLSGGGGATLRTRLPRVKSQTGRSSRSPVAASDADGLERRPDRSHRFGRREPGSLPFDGVDEVDDDLFNEVEDGSVREKKTVGLFSRTGEGSNSSNAVVDEAVPTTSSSSYKRRGSKRNILESPQYRMFLNDMGTKVADESDRGDSSTGSGDADRLDKNHESSDRKEEHGSKD